MCRKLLNIFSISFLVLSCQSQKKISNFQIVSSLDELNEKERLITIDQYFLIAHEYLRLGNIIKAEKVFCFLYPYAPAKLIGLKIVDLNKKLNRKKKAMQYLEHLKILYPKSNEVKSAFKLFKKKEL